MFFEELVEQHRVYFFIADSVGLTVCIARYQVGFDLCHLFSDKAELGMPLGSRFFL